MAPEELGPAFGLAVLSGVHAWNTSHTLWRLRDIQAPLHRLELDGSGYDVLTTLMAMEAPGYAVTAVRAPTGCVRRRPEPF